MTTNCKKNNSEVEDRVSFIWQNHLAPKNLHLRSVKFQQKLKSKEKLNIWERKSWKRAKINSEKELESMLHSNIQM
jgi:hypothetical protein